jgi:DNA-binding MarR family transcriptional regulator
VVAEPTRWLDEAEQQIWRRLLSVDCRLRERLDRELRSGASLTLGEYDVLVHLSEAPGRSLRMSDLAQRLLLSRSGLTRRPCNDDKRGSLAELTPAGFEHLQRAAPVHVGGVRRYLFDPLDGPDGLAGLAHGLDRIGRALGAE